MARQASDTGARLAAAMGQAVTGRTASALKLVTASLAPKSRQLYERAMDRYLKFSTSHYNLEAHWPASVLSLIEFIGHMHDGHYAASTITSYVSALSFMHKLSLHKDPAESFLVKKALAGASKLRPAADLRRPITPGILHHLRKVTPQATSSNFNAMLLSAMFTLAFHAFLRVGEIAVANQEDQRVIHRRDLVFQHTRSGHPMGMHLTIRHYKHQGSRPPSHYRH